MQKRIKAVLDTNILISALIGSKTCQKIRDDFVSGLFDVFISEDILGEFLDITRNPHFNTLFNEENIRETADMLTTIALPVVPQEKVSVCRDSEDNMVLECALAGHADFIVTRDKDLLVVRTFKNMRILTPQKFIKKTRSLRA